MSDLELFQNDQWAIRAILIDGQPHFIMRDVCDALEITKRRDAFAGLNDDEKGYPVLVDTPGGPQYTPAVNEPGLYRLIFQSRKPEAETFKRWVTHEVLPAIRERGYYTATPNAEHEALARLARILMGQP